MYVEVIAAAQPANYIRRRDKMAKTLNIRTYMCDPLQENTVLLFLCIISLVATNPPSARLDK